jgi:hypothetical protein
MAQHCVCDDKRLGFDWWRTVVNHRAAPQRSTSYTLVVWRQLWLIFDFFSFTFEHNGTSRDCACHSNDSHIEARESAFRSCWRCREMAARAFERQVAVSVLCWQQLKRDCGIQLVALGLLLQRTKVRGALPPVRAVAKNMWCNFFNKMKLGVEGVTQYAFRLQ